MEMSKALYHHGRLHQKWGVRNGPPYPLESGVIKGYASKQKSKKGSADTSGRRTTAKERHKMSDAELNKRLERVKKENELRKQEAQNNEGQAFAEDVLKDIGKRVLTTAVTGAVLYAGKAFISQSFNAGELANAIFNGGAKKK